MTPALRTVMGGVLNEEGAQGRKNEEVKNDLLG